MRCKGTLWFLLLLSLLIMLLGCGRKAPPTLPEKPSSLVLNKEIGEQDLSKEAGAFLGGRWKEMKLSPSIDGFLEKWSIGVME